MHRAHSFHMYTHTGAGWHIRDFERRDYRPCYQLFRDCLREFPWRGPAAPYLRQLFNSLPTARAWVAEEPQAGVVGFIIFDEYTGYVSHLFVEQDWRFCGVGSGLLDAVQGIARNPLHLDVDEQNYNALQMYQRLGWTEVVGTPKPRQGQRRMSGP